MCQNLWANYQLFWMHYQATYKRFHPSIDLNEKHERVIQIEMRCLTFVNWTRLCFGQLETQNKKFEDLTLGCGKLLWPSPIINSIISIYQMFSKNKAYRQLQFLVAALMLTKMAQICDLTRR